MSEVTCSSCPNIVDSFGNFVECKLLQKGLNHTFVDWYYWNNDRPDDCPLYQLVKHNGNKNEIDIKKKI